MAWVNIRNDMLQKNQLQAEASYGREYEDDTIDLFALFSALWRGKITIILFAILALLVGGYYAFGLAVPTYRSSTQLALEKESSSIIDIQAIVPSFANDDITMNTEVQVITSRGILKQLVEQLELTQDPEFNKDLVPDADPFSDLISGQIGRFFGLEAEVEEQVLSDEQILNDTIDQVREAISARVQTNTYIFDVGVTTQAPEKSQLMANTLAEIYIADQIDQTFSATETAVSWLSDRVAELEAELRASEDELKSLRTEVDLVSVEALEALNRQLIDARERAETARTSLTAAEERQEQIASLRVAEDYEELALLLGDPSFTQLVESDATESAIEDRISSIVERTDSDLARQRRQADALTESVTRLEEQVGTQSEDLVQLQQIEREVQATRTLYETFLTRLKEATVQRGLAQAESRVLSEAIPGHYVSPQKPIILATALMIGLLAGTAVVLARQFANKGYRSAEELEAGTGLPILGQIPLMPIKRRNQLISYLNETPGSAAAEAVRNLRTSILLSSPGKPPQIIMSTSSLPGEGKTTQAIALAQNFDGLQKKVLLIEGDVRRRTLQEYFKSDPDNLGGIVSALHAESLEDARKFMVRDPRLNADVLLGEKAEQNAADLFSSETFVKFLEQAKAYYDYIIIDTPPVLLVPDARVIGQHVDAIIFNVAWDRTSRAQVKEALRQLSTVNLAVGGMVLGQIDPSGMKRYGYGGKYGSYASYGNAYYDT